MPIFPSNASYRESLRDFSASGSEMTVATFVIELKFIPCNAKEIRAEWPTNNRPKSKP